MKPLHRESYITDLPLDLEHWLAAIEGLRGRKKGPEGLSAPALVVLDLMALFCDPSSPAFLPAFPAIKANIFRLADTLIASGRPVLFTRHAHPEGDEGGLVKKMYSRLQRADDPLNGLIEEAQRRIPPAAEVIKDRHSPLTMDSAVSFFRGCDSLLIAGVQTQACVTATAIDCSRCGLVPVVVADACASLNERLHLSALEVLASGHAYVLGTDEVLALLSMGKDAKTEGGGV